MKIDLAIELIIPDNTAFTVLTALRQLGYSELAGVERSEHIFLTIADGASGDTVVKQLSRAEVLFNPNKHRMSYAPENARDIEPPEFEALVRDKDENNEPIRELLVTTFGVSSVIGLERAVGWRLHEGKDFAGHDRLEWACKALLCNPVSQFFEICRRKERRQVRELAARAAKKLR